MDFSVIRDALNTKIDWNCVNTNYIPRLQHTVAKIGQCIDEFRDVRGKIIVLDISAVDSRYLLPRVFSEAQKTYHFTETGTRISANAAGLDRWYVLIFRGVLSPSRCPRNIRPTQELHNVYWT